MSNNKAPNSFDILTTADGSPTLSLNNGEKMHSMAGALSESLYIYAPCIEKACQTQEPKVLSMGLGLAYNELITLALFKKYQVSGFKIASFEEVDFLKDSLLLWFEQKESPLQSSYDDISHIISEHFSTTPEEIRENGRKALDTNMWTISGSLTLENNQNSFFNSILYDAFSSETDKDLWTQEHLQQFIENYCDLSSCYFATYAATGNLKRALKEKGFLLEKKAGFGNKREATFACRLN